MLSLVQCWSQQITALLVVCFVSSWLYRNTINVTSTAFRPARTMSAKRSGASRGVSFRNHMINWKHLTVLLLTSLVGMTPLLLCLVHMGTSNGLLITAKELMMISRLLTGHAWFSTFNELHWGRFVLARAEARCTKCMELCCIPFMERSTIGLQLMLKEYSEVLHFFTQVVGYT